MHAQDLPVHFFLQVPVIYNYLKIKVFLKRSNLNWHLSLRNFDPQNSYIPTNEKNLYKDENGSYWYDFLLVKHQIFQYIPNFLQTVAR